MKHHLCPNCKRPTVVVRVYRDPHAPPAIRRERQCDRGHRHDTLETVVPLRKKMTFREAALKSHEKRRRK